ncbi:Hsp33 family molecular chaperone HslO [Piscinibacter sakaiensis]|uniref:Hsp33 family molecular chaperone HslO n=1 Tax=Piscinibacter sakaiensis TaxID=1547922 RepID=UPI0006B4A70C|nr:Hsp33 family molecular chaperone HslO [Piscinibacter sakaiensis]
MSELHKFLFEGLPVRGVLVRLDADWQEVLRRRAEGAGWPAPVQALMGEMAAAGVLLQSNISFNGALVLQVYGDGPVKLAVAEVRSDLGFRVTAKVDGEVAEDAALDALLNVQGGGRCAITLDPKDKTAGQQPYQGVVPLSGPDGEPLRRLAEVLEHYMRQSEQLDTRLVLAADGRCAAGLLIQRLPVEGVGNLAGREDAPEADESHEAFHRIAMLAATLSTEELLGLDADTLLRRLFWEEPLRRFEPQRGESGPRFACTCSRQRVGQMLVSLGRSEVDEVVEEQGRVEVGCEFCGLRYHFDAVDVGELFTPRIDQAPGSASLN